MEKDLDAQTVEPYGEINETSADVQLEIEWDNSDPSVGEFPLP